MKNIVCGIFYLLSAGKRNALDVFSFRAERQCHKKIQTIRKIWKSAYQTAYTKAID
ncbi:hypothetical protein [Planomicrobium sp. YIM 101495]|uniref:hypothetical protein n=1 Tax=Planomicrobium sp. YIM 101495 TaxID=2665160 RepID=UPI001E369376|nr:hypothetical protein [Planomicrobium sp. YIM 101495]